MNFRPNPFQSPARGGLSAFARRRGYTLVEILVALALTLMIMLAVVKVFGDVGEGIRKSRNALEQFDRLRTAAQQLNQDLNWTTAVPDGRAGRPEEGRGYLELIEGSYLYANLNAPNPPYYGVQIQTTGGTTADYTVGERGDFLMFTARNASRPFVGRYLGATVQSDVAEIAWFLRGNRLHRRVLLVMPGTAQALAQYSGTHASNINGIKTVPTYYIDNDISARLTHDASGSPIVVPNSLADLVKRENRFAHPTWLDSNVSAPFPFDVRLWGAYSLPTLAECASPTWMAKWVNGTTPPQAYRAPFKADMWDNSPNGPFSPTAVPLANNLSDQALANNGTNIVNDSTRVADDVVLTNVIGFDVKVWDPDVNSYVDLGYQASQANPQGRFTGGGLATSKLRGNGVSGTANSQCVYDTGCFSYENEGIYKLDKNGNPQIDTPGGRSTNGFADNNSVVDDRSEQIAPPPYPVPLRGIQIKIRCFEPDSKQIREITIEHDFLPK